jgi:hypothetical protein
MRSSYRQTWHGKLLTPGTGIGQEIPFLSKIGDGSHVLDLENVWKGVEYEEDGN